MKKTLLRLSVLTSLLLVMFTSTSCTGRDSQKLVYFLIDRTGTWQPEDKQHFEQSIDFLKKHISEDASGTHIVLASLNQMSTSSKILYEVDKPGFSFFENDKSPSAKKKVVEFNSNFEKHMDAIKQELTNSTQRGVASPIVEAIYNVVAHWKDIHDYKSTTLIVFSDMVQYTDKLKFVGSDPSTIITNIKKNNLLPSFDNADVYIFGAGNFDFKYGKYDSPKMKRKKMAKHEALVRSNEALWRNYFKEAHANLKFYGPAPI